ncbi:MAG TPA: alpha/beta fold hydrolase [Terracidiphilus sp.]|nr:alpha/beta fold hydrolase [Terracidiphilus sp.]
MSTFLLIHGAWHGGWCWRKVVPLLQAKGHTVLAPDLPGHGDDKTPTAQVTLNLYADRIRRIASSQPEPAILVGHSMGGSAITQAAENCPSMVRALVYMCAFLPRNGDSLTTWASQDSESLVVSTNMIRLAKGVVVMKPEAVHEAFYAMCPDEDAEFARSRLVPQSTQPFHTPVVTTPARWGAIPRYYIECNRDRALTLPTQKEMQKHSPCRQAFTIDTDHSPFFSAVEELVDILVRIGRLV